MKPDWNQLDKSDLILTNVIAYHVTDHKEEYVQTPCGGRSSYALLYVVKGAYHYISDAGTEFDGIAGDVVFLPKGSRYRHVNTQIPSEMYVTYFMIQETEAVRELMQGADISRISVYSPSIFLELFQRMSECFFSNNNAVSEVKAKLYRIIGKLANESRFHNLNERELECLKPALQLLADEKMQSVTVRELAARCFLSEYAFRELFKKWAGISPKKYIVLQRLEKADILLENPELTVSAVAELCGFETPQYFYQVYKKMRGRSPRLKNMTDL